ncbi:PKD domain-containing protein [Flavobacteriales bacterium]|nr:PKD domain-containing protein [Flavobacteriales bacterium]
MKSLFTVVSAVFVLLPNQSLFAQAVNGSAQQLSCNCFRLTEAIGNQSGSVWNNSQIDLTEPFDFTFDVYLGSIPGGADGIAFVLQPVSTLVGSTGGGLGYEGISPSLAMAIDTYDNGPSQSDPINDHVAIMANGSINHGSVDNLAGPVDALAGSPNIEDDAEHLMRVSWDPITMTVNFYMDGDLRTSYTGDIVTDIFGGDPNVFWGFTGSTGGLNNRQEFCFSIIPGLSANDFDICEGETIDFTDNSYSALGDVVSWDWNFGNGQLSSLSEPNDVEFATAGSYWVTQTIEDAEGCTASDSIEILVNPNPVADFTSTEVCEGDETNFTDESSVSVGSITDFDWDFGDGNTDAGSSVSTTFTEAGTYNVSLDISTAAGCVDSTEAQVTVNTNPVASGTGESTSLDAIFTTDLLAGEEAEWLINDTVFTDLDVVNYTFPDSGWYDITLSIVNENGCMDEVTFEIYIEGIPEYEVGNVFTPNGDELNERFQPFTYSMVEANMQVFNRWGRPVYKYDGLIPPIELWGWDGTINGGAKAAEGTYYYVLDLKGTDGNNFSEQGTVTLVR